MKQEKNRMVCGGSPPGHDVMWQVTQKLRHAHGAQLPRTEFVVANTAFVACAKLGWAMSECDEFSWEEIPKIVIPKDMEPPPFVEEPFYRHLGNFSTHPYDSVHFTCEPCRVTWQGCAAAADCPECGRGYDWTDPSAPPQMRVLW